MTRSELVVILRGFESMKSFVYVVALRLVVYGYHRRNHTVVGGCILFVCSLANDHS